MARKSATATQETGEATAGKCHSTNSLGSFSILDETVSIFVLNGAQRALTSNRTNDSGFSRLQFSLGFTRNVAH